MKTLKKLIFFGIIVSGILISSCHHDPELMPGTPEICFDRDVMLIMNSNCNMSGCHDGNGEKRALTTYEEVRSLVTPGSPNKSKLYQVITANPITENHMPPKSKPALTGSQIDIISIWIMQGANHTTCP